MQGLLLDVIQEAAPDAYAKRTKRQGIVNAWTDENFAQAVRDAGKCFMEEHLWERSSGTYQAPNTSRPSSPIVGNPCGKSVSEPSLHCERSCWSFLLTRFSRRQEEFDRRRRDDRCLPRTSRALDAGRRLPYQGTRNPSRLPFWMTNRLF